jgi:inhibitor of KinA
MPPPLLIRPLSEFAVEVQFGTEPGMENHRRVMQLAAAIRSAPFAGFVETVPAFTSLCIYFNPEVVKSHFPKETAADAVAAWLAARLQNLPPDVPMESNLVEIPVRYGAAWGPDLSEAAALLRLSEEEVIRLHTGATYTVFMIGFLPGFPYLGLLPEALNLPRLPTPRREVPAGSVAIAGRQTGIYPQASPGGWRIIGHTAVRLFDPAADPPALLQPGWRVRFLREEG